MKYDTRRHYMPMNPPLDGMTVHAYVLSLSPPWTATWSLASQTWSDPDGYTCPWYVVKFWRWIKP